MSSYIKNVRLGVYTILQDLKSNNLIYIDTAEFKNILLLSVYITYTINWNNSDACAKYHAKRRHLE